MMAFDYDTDTGADASAVADSIRSACQLPPLSAEELAQREIERQIWLAEQQRQAEQRQLDRERREAEAEAVAQREADILRRQERERQRQEYQRQQAERDRNSRYTSELSALRAEAKQAAQWRSTVQNAVAYQHRQTIMNELESMINPPAPPPEPEPQVVYVEQPDDKDRPVEVHRWFTR